MSKVISSLIAVLLVTSVTLADVSQTESFLAGLGNGVTLLSCSTHAGSNNSLIIDNKQSGIGSHATAQEFQLGVFRQVANGNGNSAHVVVVQELGSAGTQLQMIGSGVAPKAQQETLALTAVQGVVRGAGDGTGTAGQFAAVAQGQTGTNVAGAVSQSSALVASQDAFVTGIPQSTGMAGSTTQVATSQTQLVN